VVRRKTPKQFPLYARRTWQCYYLRYEQPAGRATVARSHWNACLDELQTLTRRALPGHGHLPHEDNQDGDPERVQ